MNDTIDTAETLYTAVSSTPHCPKLRAKAEEIAGRFSLPYIAEPLSVAENTPFLLMTEEGLALSRYRTDLKREKYRIERLAFVDFLHGKQGYRLRHNCTIQQPLAKAAGIKKGRRPQIIDTTAGLGGDSSVFASLGCTVLLFERNPLIAALLADGLQRAEESCTIPQIIGRMRFKRGNAIDFLTAAAENGERMEETTIYLDPMYPHTNSTAEKKIAMRALRQVVGDDSDAEDLLAAAVRCSPKRIVVKRPRLAAALPSACGRVPDYSLLGKSCRYDIYLFIGRRKK